LTLLMVLFLVLWVISTIDLKKFEQFKSGLGDFGNKAAAAAAPSDTGPGSGDQESTSSTTGDGATADSSTTTSSTEAGAPGTGNGSTPPLDKNQLAEVAKQLDVTIDQSGLDGVVDVHLEERGLVVSISTDNVLFESGSGTLTPAGATVLGSVAPQIALLPNDVIIEGYTDKRPLRRAGYDNWDLSVDRAVSVLKELRDNFGFVSTRLAATGYGDTHPVADGDDEASLARNRRVELVIVAGPSLDAPTDTTTVDASPSETSIATTVTIAGATDVTTAHT
ncbi:MAG: Flagellar motor rotation protein MotB, partial [Acidimicrobiales bacterium]|nr:Flagellar motor rotation protein MotB [Acidimicrobiales bacterium]